MVVKVGSALQERTIWGWHGKRGRHQQAPSVLEKAQDLGCTSSPLTPFPLRRGDKGGKGEKRVLRKGSPNWWSY